MTHCRLLYTSEADLPDGTARHAAAAIAERAQQSNARMDITGALVLARGTFIQVLEGPPASVETVFETICCDFRHRRVRLIELATVTDRLFGAWSMACLAQDDQPTRLRVNRDLEELCFTVNTSAATALRQIRALLDGRPIDV